MSKNKTIIYHNNRCGKSRDTLQIIKESGIEYDVIEYLKNPPSPEVLKDILAKLGKTARSIVREKEKLFQEKFKHKNFAEEEWIQILCEHPILIERPIVVDGYKAIIARPPELASELINRKKPA